MNCEQEKVVELNFALGDFDNTLIAKALDEEEETENGKMED